MSGEKVRLKARAKKEAMKAAAVAAAAAATATGDGGECLEGEGKANEEGEEKAVGVTSSSSSSSLGVSSAEKKVKSPKVPSNKSLASPPPSASTTEVTEKKKAVKKTKTNPDGIPGGPNGKKRRITMPPGCNAKGVNLSTLNLSVLSSSGVTMPPSLTLAAGSVKTTQKDKPPMGVSFSAPPPFNATDFVVTATSTTSPADKS